MERTGDIEQVQGSHTWDEFLKLEDDDRRELIDGEFVEVEVMPGGPHEYTVTQLITLLTAWTHEHRTGFVLASGYKVRITERRGIMPDVQFYRFDNPCLPAGYEGLESGHPDLAVEVISPSSGRYDRVIKLGYYASIGTPEYWIIHPEEHTLEQLGLRDDAYVTVSKLAKDDIFRPDAFAKLEIPLSRLWTPPQVLAMFAALEGRPFRPGE